jgi:alkanesulfonate monooxygenase SsuD/methylene tetrahydromethanopterin reductase-like flavin-dependent oxidoreductase (luciferase family)
MQLPAQTGVWLFPGSVDRTTQTVGHPQSVVDAIEVADAAGIDEVWLGDEGVYGWDPFVLAGVALSRTTHVRVGVGVANPVTRHPSVLGQNAATLHALAPGRFMLGLGIGGSMPLDPFGLVAAKVADVQHAIDVIREAVGANPPTGVRIANAPTIKVPMVPVYIGARGERLNRLASARADGVLLSGVAPEKLDEVIGWAHSVHPVKLTILPVLAVDAALCDELDQLRSTYPGAVVGVSLIGDDVLASMQSFVTAHR